MKSICSCCMILASSMSHAKTSPALVSRTLASHFAELRYTMPKHHRSPDLGSN